MKYILYTIWLVGLIIYFHSSRLAQGKALLKINQKESFLHGQIVSAILFATGIVAAVIASERIFLTIFIINFIFDILFYLQPTPRTTGRLLKVIMALNFVFLVYKLISVGSAA